MTRSPTAWLRPRGAMTVAAGFEPGAVIGPLIDMKAVEEVEAHISDAVKKGAKVVTGGKRSALGGTFFEPTVLTDVATDMVSNKEETFGPVAPLYRFRTAAEAIKVANDTPTLPSPACGGGLGRGLAAYFYSRDSGRIWRVAEGLEYGIGGINEGIISTEIAPFGGMKESGIGPSGDPLGLEIRQRGIPRSQIPLHGRHRPLGRFVGLPGRRFIRPTGPAIPSERRRCCGFCRGRRRAE